MWKRVRLLKRMTPEAAPESADRSTLPRWEDLEAFLVIAAGVEAGKTIQQTGETGAHGYGGPRLLYERLARLEKALGARLIERRKWSRNTHLTEEGRWLAAELRRLRSSRTNLQQHFTEREGPALRLSATSTIIGTFLPTVVQALKRHPELKDLRLALVDREREEDVINDVHENRASVGIALLHGHVHTPSDLRIEKLFESPRVLLCHESHPFVTRARHDPSRATVQLSEITHECVFVRPHDTRHLPPPSSVGEHFIVPRFEEARAYVRVGLGITVSLEVLERLLGPDEHLQTLPLLPAVRLPIGLILPRKREQASNGPLAEFLETVRAVGRAVGGPGVGAHWPTRELPSPSYRRLELPQLKSPHTPPRRVAVPFDHRVDITAADWLALGASLEQFRALQYWEDYLSLSSYLVRMDQRRALQIVRPTTQAWAGMEAILQHWRARENWHEFAWYALTFRFLSRLFERPDLVIEPHEWAGMYAVLQELRTKREWHHFVRHASRIVRLDPPRRVTFTDHEWSEIGGVLEHFRQGAHWFDYGWLARTATIVDDARARRLIVLGPRDWAALHRTLALLRRPGDDPRRWFAFAQHAYSMARIAERSRDIPVRQPVAASTRMGKIRAVVPARIHERR